jgi:hypothetical protein
VDPSSGVQTGDDEEQLALLESLPDYPRDDLRHRIKERHVGWDGALEGYSLEDGTYVNVKARGLWSGVWFFGGGCSNDVWRWAAADNVVI